MRATKTKTERRRWWNGLASEEKAQQIERWQKRRQQRRKNKPQRKQEYDSRYPWATEGVNDSNRRQWRKVILTKNPWLSKI